MSTNTTNPVIRYVGVVIALAVIATCFAILRTYYFSRLRRQNARVVPITVPSYPAPAPSYSYNPRNYPRNYPIYPSTPHSPYTPSNPTFPHSPSPSTPQIPKPTVAVPDRRPRHRLDSTVDGLDSPRQSGREKGASGDGRDGPRPASSVTSAGRDMPPPYMMDGRD